MFFFLALRNIAKNKKQSSILVLFIAVITFLFLIGNSVLGNADRSIRESYIESLTGDVVIQKSGDVTMNLFGANTPIMDRYFTIPVFPAFDTVWDLLVNEDGIAGMTSQVSGNAMLSFLSYEEPTLLCGVETESYFSLFPGIILERGRFLVSGEYGAMINMEMADKIERECGRSLQTGENILLTLGGYAGFKIREVPIVGIYKYKNPGRYMSDVVITDPQTVRVLNSIQVAGGNEIELGEDILSLFSSDPDGLFGDSFFSGEENLSEGFSVEWLENYLGQSGQDEPNEISGGDWNFIIIRLKNGISPNGFISGINKKIAPFGVTAVNWRLASGTSAILILLVQALFNAGIFLICIAGVIATVNLLLISVFQRTGEIGTLRTIGASDSYIRSLILSENLVISLIAGVTGVLSGFIALSIINCLKISISNELLASLFGGSMLHLDFIPGIAFFSVLVAAALGILASLYPIEIAVRIEPMDAVRRR